MDNKKIVFIVSGIVFFSIVTLLTVILIKNNIKNNNEEEQSFIITLINDNEEQTINGKKDEIIKLPTYSKEGYNFIGFIDEDGNNYNNELVISKDLTLTAKYEPLKYYNINFVSEPGVDYSVIMAYYQEKISLPTPIKEGYTFSHWIDEENNVFNYTEYPYEKDVLLKAVWIKNEAKKYTVKFDTDGGNKIDDQIVLENGTIAKPNNPKKEGYCFTGWQYNYNNYDFNKNVKSNMTLKATYNELFALNKDIFNLINSTYKDLSNKFGIQENTIKKQKTVSTNKGKGYSADGSILYKNGYYAYYNFFTFSSQNYIANLNKQKPEYIAFDSNILFTNYKREFITESNLKCLGYTNIKYIKKKSIYKFNYGKYIIELYNFNTEKEKAYVWNIN